MYYCLKIVFCFVLTLSLVVQLVQPVGAEVTVPDYSNRGITAPIMFLKFPQIAFIHSSPKYRLETVENHSELRNMPKLRTQLMGEGTTPKEKAHTGVDIEGVEVENKKGQTRFKVDRFHVSVETLRDAIQNPAKLVALDMTMNSAKGLYDSFNSYKSRQEDIGSPIAPCQVITIRQKGSNQIFYIYEGNPCPELYKAIESDVLLIE